jgi:pilus assembly protein FimV
MNNKSQRLLSLKDSEIAELQNKLKQLEAGKGQAKPADASAQAAKPGAAATPTPPVASTPAPAPAVATPPAAATPAPAAMAAAPAQPPAAAPTATPAAPAAAPATPPVSSSPAAAPAVPAVATPTPPASSSPAASPVASTPAAATPAATPAPPPPAAKPATPPAAAKPTAAAAKTAPTAKPWYADYVGDNPYLLYGGAGGILLLIAGWLLTRSSGAKKPNPRPLPAAAAAVADGDAGEDAHAALEKEAEHYYDGTPGGDAGHAHQTALHTDGEDDEMEQLRRHFDDGDSDRFVALAHTLHEKFPEDSAEWQEVAELGRQMLPGSPLFAVPTHAAHADHPDNFFFDEATHAQGEEVAVNETDAYNAQIKAMADPDEPLAFDVQHTHEGGELADLEFEREFGKQVDAEPEAPLEDEPAEGRRTFLDEDTVGTRLDLARAYLDMGDPEGARSMLDEVLAEGNPTQKEEARKLLAELS